MKNADLVSALDSVKADPAFRQRLKEGLGAQPRKRWTAYAAVAAACLLLVTGTIYHFTGSNFPSAFTITGEAPAEACYIMVVYIDGYSYTASGWQNISSDSFTRGEKLGEVSLDLKGLSYTGVPPNFSSTLKKGTEIYSIQGLKKEYAILAVEGTYQNVLFREGEVFVEGKKPKLSTVGQVIATIAHSPQITAAELLDEENGGLMATNDEAELLALFTTGLTRQPLASWDSDSLRGRRIPLNLVFQGGEILHLQVYPEAGKASVFGGLVTLPLELVAACEEFADRGPQYQTIASLLPYGETEVDYLRGINLQSGQEMAAQEDSWLWKHLYVCFNYWRLAVQEEPVTEKTSTLTLICGRSEQDSTTLQFFSSPRGTLLEYEGQFYRLVRNMFDVEKEIEEAFRNY